jgi:hypothetical protein
MSYLAKYPSGAAVGVYDTIMEMLEALENHPDIEELIYERIE